ncbi:HMA2 domain-containing protein [Pseudodesulfovibrio sp.]|uniref:HMA2 domain-containing protein n=1 Tax=unclassified Pseudodesulfovibrio TaxID=2661612 RepID=UPI003B007678
MHFSDLMSLRKYLTIQHHVPGRIRIKFGLALLADPRAKAVREASEGRSKPACIHDVRINKLTRNIIIEYDPTVIDPKKLHEALTTLDEERFNQLAAELETVTAA